MSERESVVEHKKNLAAFVCVRQSLTEREMKVSLAWGEKVSFAWDDSARMVVWVEIVNAAHWVEWIGQKFEAEAALYVWISLFVY